MICNKCNQESEALVPTRVYNTTRTQSRVDYHCFDCYEGDITLERRNELLVKAIQISTN